RDWSSDVCSSDLCDVSRLGCAQHVADLAFDASHAALFGVAAQIASIERGVEMIGIAQKRSGCSRDSHVGKRELVPLRDDFGEAILTDPVRMPMGAAVQPVLMEVEPVD